MQEERARACGVDHQGCFPQRPHPRTQPLLRCWRCARACLQSNASPREPRRRSHGVRKNGGARTRCERLWARRICMRWRDEPIVTSWISPKRPYMRRKSASLPAPRRAENAGSLCRRLETTTAVAAFETRAADNRPHERDRGARGAGGVPSLLTMTMVRRGRSASLSSASALSRPRRTK